MRLIGPAFALITTVRAACDVVLWKPNSGDTVQEAADALQIGVDTFKHWNPKLTNVDNIHTDQTFTVSYTSSLDGAAVWVTKGCSRFLHLDGTPPVGHETSVASLTSTSTVSPTSTEATLPASPTSSPRPRSIPPSPRQSEESSSSKTAASSVTTTTTTTTALTATTTTSLSDRPTEDASPTPALVCGGSRDGPPLLCNPKNDGTFFTNGVMIDKFIEKACKKHGGRFLSPHDVISERMDYPDKPITQYEVMAYVDPGDEGTHHLRMPTGEECMEHWGRNFWDCCNGGNGGSTRYNKHIVMQGHPLHKGKPPKDAYKIIESWS